MNRYWTHIVHMLENILENNWKHTETDWKIMWTNLGKLWSTHFPLHPGWPSSGVTACFQVFALGCELFYINRSLIGEVRAHLSNPDFTSTISTGYFDSIDWIYPHLSKRPCPNKQSKRHVGNQFRCPFLLTSVNSPMIFHDNPWYL